MSGRVEGRNGPRLRPWQKGNLWVKIRSLPDGYEGWLTGTLLEEINEDDAKSYCELSVVGSLKENKFCVFTFPFSLQAINKKNKHDIKNDFLIIADTKLLK